METVVMIVLRAIRTARELNRLGFNLRRARCSECHRRLVFERGVENWCLCCGYGALWAETKADEMPWLLDGRLVPQGDRLMWKPNQKRPS